MAENGTVAYISIPKMCDFCANKEAKFDFRTITGQWANGCEHHYLAYRASTPLGVGKGQQLVVRS